MTASNLITKSNPASVPFDLLDAISYPLSAFGPVPRDGDFTSSGGFKGYDHTPTLAAAAASGEWVRLPPGRMRMSGSAPFKGATTKLWGEQYVLANDVSAGTWFLRDEPAVSSFVIGGEYPLDGTTSFTSQAIASSITNVGFIEAHPVPSATPGTPWTPVDYQPCISIDNLFGAAELDNIMGLWCSRLAEVHSNGHVRIGTMHGQCFRSMLAFSNCLDECELHTLRNWTYKTTNPNVLDWQRANLDLLQLFRIDGLIITGRVSGLACRSLLHAMEEPSITGQLIAAANTPGGASSVQGGRFAGDQCQTAIWLDGLEASIVNRTFMFESLQSNGFNGTGSYLPDARAILMDTSGGVEIMCPSLVAFYYPEEAVRLRGNTNSLQVAASRFKAHNLAMSRGLAPAGALPAAAIVVEDSGGKGFRNQSLLSTAYVVDSGKGHLYDAGGDGVRICNSPPLYDGRPPGALP